MVKPEYCFFSCVTSCLRSLGSLRWGEDVSLRIFFWKIVRPIISPLAAVSRFGMQISSCIASGRTNACSVCCTDFTEGYIIWVFLSEAWEGKRCQEAFDIFDLWYWIWCTISLWSVLWKYKCRWLAGRVVIERRNRKWQRYHQSDTSLRTKDTALLVPVAT